MALEKLYLTPLQDGYSYSYDGTDVVRAKPSSGPSRQRLDMLGGTILVGVSFMLSPAELQYWQAFTRTILSERSLPFLIDLVIDSSELREYEAKIVPGSASLPQLAGNAFKISCQLEAKPRPTDRSLDESIVDLFPVYRDDLGPILDALAILVNVTAPLALNA